MSNERPLNAPSPIEAPSTPKQKTDDQRQDRLEREAVQRFTAEVLMASDLSQEDRLAAAKAVETQPGQWRQYNGVDISVKRLERLAGKVKVHFLIEDPDMGKMEMDDDIVLG